MRQQDDGNKGKQKAEVTEPGSETERFRAITDVRHNEAVTGESGVKRSERDHELRCQQASLAEFE
jgi:hypothetical protein